MGLVGVLSGRALLVALVLLAEGCVFHKTVRNHYVQDLDPSWIVVGVTTWEDVLDRWGPPMPRTSEALIRELPTVRYFRYSLTETHAFTITFPPVYVLLPWSWADEQRTREVVVEFDEAGVVSDAYVRTDDPIWRPFESETDREQGKTVFPARLSGK